MNRAGMLRLAVYLKDAMLLAMENYAFDLLMGGNESRPMKRAIGRSRKYLYQRAAARTERHHCARAVRGLAKADRGDLQSHQRSGHQRARQRMRKGKKSRAVTIAGRDRTKGDQLAAGFE
jgi:hypothetical protein